LDLLYFAAVVHRNRAISEALDKREKLLHNGLVHKVNEKILEIIIKMFEENKI
jgi:hypothetical protein